MTAEDIQRLEPGRHYMTLTRGQKRRVRRAFKATYERFGGIPCAVFTSKITARVKTWTEGDSWFERGPWRELPRGECDVPHYDLLEAIPCS